MAQVFLLLIFILIAALTALEASELAMSVIMLAVSGLGICLAMVLLNAPEVAMVQLAAEVLMLALIVRYASDETDVSERTAPSARMMFIALALLALWASYDAFKMLPGFGLGAIKVLPDHRNIDSMGAVSAIFASVIGLMCVLRKKAGRSIDDKKDI